MSRWAQHDWFLTHHQRARRSATGPSPYSRRLRIEPLEDRRLLALVTVDTLNDTVDFGDGVTSLREAIFATNLVGGADTIQFAASLTSGGPATITLTQGELAITDSLSINGPGANLLTIDASGNDPTPDQNNGDGSRIFDIEESLIVHVDGTIANHGVSISGLTLTGGDAGSNGGGAILARGELTVANCTISGNSATGRGGGIFGRNLTVINSSIRGNSAQYGGGLATSLGIGELTLTGSTVNGNSASSDGGGIFGTFVTVNDSTISGNLAGENGGGIGGAYDAFSGGGLSATNSTIHGNTAGLDGGGVFKTQTAANLSHTIIAGNTRGTGEANDVTGSVTVAFSLLGVDTGATLTDNGGNLIGTAATQIDPLLGPLTDYGGPTMTQALLAGSPAINRGDLSAVSGVGDVPEFDQRGAPFGRVFGGRIDIGAFEYQAASDLNLVVDTLTDESDGNYALGDLSLREAILLANTYPSTDTIRFAPVLVASGPATILLTMGELAIIDNTSIIGLGANQLTIDASGNDPTPDVNNGDGTRVFNIDNANTANVLIVSISGLTLTGGDVTDSGGAISSRETLTVTDSTISGNSAIFGSGGGIRKTGSGSLLVTNSTISGNSAYSGGGIYSRHISGSLTLTGSSIVGNSAGGRSGGGLSVFGGTTFITDCAMSGNSAAGDGGAISILTGNLTVTRSTLVGNAALGTSNGYGRGGAIYTRENLTVTESTISGNSAASGGGGIWSEFLMVVVSNSTISGNSAASDGGGILKRNGNLTVSGSTISGNSAAAKGGGIYGRYTIAVNGSTISGNSAQAGGGISSSGTLVVTASALHGNTAGVGGGIRHFNGSLTVESSTISGNSAAGNGGGLYLFTAGTSEFAVRHSTIVSNRASGLGGGISVFGGHLDIDHTILAQNSAVLGRDLVPLLGAVIDARFNLISDNANSGLAEAPVGSPDANGNLIGGPVHGVIDPQLGPLGSNGGPTMTHLLVVGSPAINAGDPSAASGVATVPAFDQRDAPFDRIYGGRIDFGALERQSLPTQSFVVDTLIDESDGDYSAGDFSLREAIGLANGSVGSDTITFAASLTGSGPATIILTHGGLQIFESLAIDGPGPNLLTIDASGNDPTPDVNNGDGSSVFTISNYVAYPNPPQVQNVALSGLTLTGGDVSGYGGAISSRETLTVSNCTISGNSAGQGGGIDSGGGTLSVTDSTISGNSAEGNGGGIYVHFGNVTLIGTTISGNTAGDNAGGIWVRQGNLALIGTTISGNSAGGNSIASSGGGGIYSWSFQFVAIVTITDSTISGNSAEGNGGGIFDSNVNVTVTNSTISGNSAARYGGGIYKHSGGLTVTNSTISGNSAGGSGGGIISRVSTVTVTDSTISGNTATAGGAGGISAYRVFVTNSTISGNSAGIDGGGGISGFNVTVSNSTISGNSAAGGGGGIRTSGSPALSHTIVAGNLVAGSSNDISGTVASSSAYNLIGVNSGVAGISHGTNGNQIGTPGSPIDPLLGPLADNGGPTMTHALLSGSPAIDAGSAGSGFDQRGAPFTRVFDGNGNGAAQSDIGAFELQPIPAALFGDYSEDGDVNAADYVVWRKFLGSNVTPYSGADGSGNGIVDQDDHGVWRAHFGQSVPPPPATGSVAGLAEIQPQSPAASRPAAQIRQGEAATSDGSLSVQMVAELRGEENSVGGQAKRSEKAVEPRASRGELFAPRSLLRIPSRPSTHASFSVGSALAASRRDDALVAWMASHRDVTQQGEESVAIDAWKNDDAGKADETYTGSIDEVFALLASG